MADKMDKKLAASPLQQVTVEKKAAPLIPISVTAVQLASLWALLSAAILVGSFALACTLVKHHIDPFVQPSWMRPRTWLTGAGVAQEMAVSHWAMWCSMAQAAATALALLLPDRHCRWSRRALAYAALAATATGHLRLARVAALCLTADSWCITCSA